MAYRHASKLVKVLEEALVSDAGLRNAITHEGTAFLGFNCLQRNSSLVADSARVGLSCVIHKWDALLGFGCLQWNASQFAESIENVECACRVQYLFDDDCAQKENAEHVLHKTISKFQTNMTCCHRQGVEVLRS